jgi:hypothetical protein
VKLFVLDSHTIYRRGLVACLDALEEVEGLSYSGRTVKNVLHDVVTKLNARSRSQAVAFAVREGAI